MTEAIAKKTFNAFQLKERGFLRSFATASDFVVKNRKGNIKPREYNVYINKAYNLKQDKNGTKDEIPASDIIKYEGEKGGNTDDYWNIYTTDEHDNLVLKETINTKRGDGSINNFRVREDEKATVSASIAVDKHGKELYSIIMEPKGPSTTEPSQKKRIPTEEYGFILSKERDCVKRERQRTGKDVKLKFPNRYVLYNKEVPDWRAITLHGGQFWSQTQGCPMPGIYFGIGMPEQDKKIESRHFGYLRVFDENLSKLKSLEKFIKAVGPEKVKYQVFDVIPEQYKVHQDP